MTSVGEPQGMRACRVALGLLSPVVMAGCLNPLFLDRAVPDADHAPVLVNMQPPPNVNVAQCPLGSTACTAPFGRLDVNVGDGCAPLTTFAADRLEDADLDPLTVRKSIIFANGVEDAPKRLRLSDTEIDPSAEPVDGSFYDFPPFQLDQATVTDILPAAVLDEQVDADHSKLGQIFELSISDGGFKGDDTAAPEGFAVTTVAWPIRLKSESCINP